MNESEWRWADLRGEQLEMVREAEETLGSGVDYVLVYQHGQGAGNGSTRPPQAGLQVAGLNESQVECLQGLEMNVKGVAVAYAQNRS